MNASDEGRCDWLGRKVPGSISAHHTHRHTTCPVFACQHGPPRLLCSRPIHRIYQHLEYVDDSVITDAINKSIGQVGQSICHMWLIECFSRILQMKVKNCFYTLSMKQLFLLLDNKKVPIFAFSHG